jgi:hypothetical protein
MEARSENWSGKKERKFRRITKADRLTRGTRFTNIKNKYKRKQYNSNPAPRYGGLVPPFYDYIFGKEIIDKKCLA